jgi:hypothetical protein
MATRAGRGNNDFRALGFKRLTEMVGVVGPVREQATRWCDVVEQSVGDADVGDIAWRQDKGDRSALSVGQSVDLAGPPTT